MSQTLTDLEPRELWRHFSALTQIPRPSGHEEAAAAWARGVAERHGFGVRSDARGNLVIDVPGSAGCESAPTVVIQGHLDMVCEKNRDVEHDFMSEPIRTRVEGEWVRAEGTTLGADNGIGVAAALAAATDPEVVHPPLEILLTLDEETGLTGAQQLDGSLLRGHTLLNLDSEEDGVLYVGCAGGADVHLHLSPARQKAPAGSVGRQLEVRGLRGGHSGLDIDGKRGNAIKLLARLLDRAAIAGVDWRLASMEGGGKHNAIPREAYAALALDASGAATLERLVVGALPEFLLELEGSDDGLQIEVREIDVPVETLAAADGRRLTDLLLALPHGVLAMSADLPGLVETSSNLATVLPLDDGRYRIVTSSRSSVMPSLSAVVGGIDAAGRLAGAAVERRDGYPGWKPDLGSPVLAVAREVYREIWQRDPEVTAIHAGLECGLLGEKKPGLDMVSFGPQITGAHSPEERVNVPSVARFWRALGGILERLARA